MTLDKFSELYEELKKIDSDNDLLNLVHIDGSGIHHTAEFAVRYPDISVHNRISKYIVELNESIERKTLENKVLEAQEKLREIDSENDLLNFNALNNPLSVNKKEPNKGLKNYLVDLEDEYDIKVFGLII